MLGIPYTDDYSNFLDCISNFDFINGASLDGSFINNKIFDKSVNIVIDEGIYFGLKDFNPLDLSVVSVDERLDAIEDVIEFLLLS